MWEQGNQIALWTQTQPDLATVPFHLGHLSQQVFLGYQIWMAIYIIALDQTGWPLLADHPMHNQPSGLGMEECRYISQSRFPLLERSDANSIPILNEWRHAPAPSAEAEWPAPGQYLAHQVYQLGAGEHQPVGLHVIWLALKWGQRRDMRYRLRRVEREGLVWG
jgi:hypothetical protein